MAAKKHVGKVKMTTEKIFLGTKLFAEVTLPVSELGRFRDRMYWVLVSSRASSDLPPYITVKFKHKPERGVLDA